MTDPPSTAVQVPPSTTQLTFSNSLSVATLPAAEVRTFELPVPGGSETITAQLLGYATSHRMRHNKHANEQFAIPGEKCPACRWFEARIFRLATDHDGAIFAVHTQGPSLVPGEIMKCRLAYGQSGYEVVELLTVRKADAIFLPAASSRALAQAAGLDRDIETAYVNRAV